MNTRPDRETVSRQRDGVVEDSLAAYAATSTGSLPEIIAAVSERVRGAVLDHAEHPSAAAPIASAASSVLGRALERSMACTRDERTLSRTLGLAASFVSPAGRTDAGDAGSIAARLARSGWDAPRTWLHGANGLARLVAGTQESSSPSDAVSDAVASRALAVYRDADGQTLDAGRIGFGNAVALMRARIDETRLVAAVGALEDMPGRRGRILGRREPIAAHVAAFLHGAAGHLDDFDDTHTATVVHPGVPVAAALTAVADVLRISGRTALAAFIAGVEAAVSVGALIPRALTLGWHMTGLSGPVGAAVAVALAGGADRKQLVRVIDAAAERAAGITEALGTMAKPMHVGNAARSGVLAAFHQPVTADGGLSALVAVIGDEDPSRRLQAMPSPAVLDNVVKTAACGVLGHSSIDAAIALRAVRKDPPLAVELHVSDLAVGAMGNSDPRTGLESKFSVPHAFAVAYCFGDADPLRFTDSAAVDPRVREVRGRIRLHADDACARYEARVRAEWPDGHVARITVDAPSAPTAQEVRAKASRLLGTDFLPFARAAFEIDALGSLAELFELDGSDACPRTSREGGETSQH
ncbi:MmgE/PrpD family protein [Microbacterium soli]|uniref:MmgE/PrpD family protein n=1 Tax=Microbacterium soli TaxID=446075 RepID=A0ABP7MT83_9MICO